MHAFQACARGAGLEISDVVVNGRGALTCCRAPDGYLVEVSSRAR